MELWKRLVFTLIIWAGSGCTAPPAGPPPTALTPSSAPSPADQAATPAAPLEGYTSTMTVTPDPPEVGKPAHVTFQVTGPDGPGAKIDYEVVHEKEAHLLLISRDLAEYQHLHPEKGADGSWGITVNFPAPGPYRFFLDVTPKDQSQQVLRSDVTVPGEAPAPAAELKVDLAPKTVTGVAPGPGLSSGHSSHAAAGDPSGGVKVELKTDPSPLKAGPATLTYRLTANGKPVRDLEHYLGALGHLVIVDTSQELFLHAHPTEHAEGQAKPAGGPDVVFKTSFPSAGTYKMWAQFQRAGKIMTVPFVVAVGAADPASTAEPTPDGKTYTCPMHPEVLSDRPGQCPKCHMDLEPKKP